MPEHTGSKRCFDERACYAVYRQQQQAKVIHPKYSKHWPYSVAHTIDCVCCKMLNHRLNHGFFLSLFKLIPCPIQWIVCVLAYLNFIFEYYSSFSTALPKTASSAQTHKSISFIWIVWSTLYVYLWSKAKLAYIFDRYVSFFSSR